MPYQSTPGLPSDVIFEIVARVHDVAQGRGIDFRRHRIGLYKQVLITLILLRQNMSQMVIADMYQVSQSTISRIRETTPLHQTGQSSR